MKKSFTRLLSLVMLLGFLTIQAAVAAVGETKVWPKDGTAPDLAYTKTTDKLMIIYPEAVVASTGSVRLSNGSGLVRVLPATDSRISYAKGDTVEIDFSADLKELVAYSVVVDANAFKTADDGEATSAINTWAFTTGDYTSPTLKSVVPKKGDVVGDQTTYTLEMTFEDNALAAVLKGSGHVSLYKADGNVWDLIDVATQGVLTGAGPYVLTLSNLRPLEDKTNYHVTIDAGAVTDNGLRADKKKNAYAGLSDRTVWTFSTKDFSVPGFADGYPKLGTPGNTSVDVMVKTLEAGKVYAAAFVKGTVVTTVDDIKNAAIKGNVTVVAGVENKISLTGIGSAALSEEYTVYVVTENSDVPADFTKKWTKDFWTSENTAPKLLVGTAVNYKKGNDVKATGTASATNVITTAVVVAQDIDNIVLTFDEKVKIGAGAVTIRKASDNSVYATVDAAKLSIVSDVNVKIPVPGLQNDAKYYVQMPNTIVLDVYNNAYAGISSTSAWAFTSNDIIPPTFTVVPADGASGVKKDADIVITFNEIVTAAPGAFEVWENNVSVPFVLTPSTNDGKFTSFKIDPAANFASEAVVVLKINDGAITDGGGNPAAVQGQGTVFVVEDYVGPSVTWDKPVNPAKPEDKIVIKFSEPVYLMGGGEITDANLYTILVLKKTDASGANVANTATISADKKVITITPSSPWESKGVYYAAVTSDLEDASGNDFDGVNRTYTFSVKDVIPATVDLSSVDGKTISTTDPVTLIFKEGSVIDPRTNIYYNGMWNGYTAADMNKVIVLKEGSATGPDVAFTATSGDAATFAIIAALSGNKTYYVGVGASTKGADGNVNIAKFVTFSTKFEGAPTVDNLNPANKSTEVAKGSNFLITYNTDVEKVAPLAPGAIYFSIDNGATSAYDVTDAMVSISGKVVTINPAADLSNDMNYDLIVAGGLFKNKNSAATNAPIAANEWEFATKDTKLDVITLSPDNVGNVAIDAKLVMTFNEKAFIGTGYLDIKDAITDALIERINAGQFSLSGDQKTVTITPTNKLNYNVNYYVEVTEGALVDWVGNKQKAIFGKTPSAAVTDWTFTTADPAIVVVKTTPANGADKIANNASIVVEFNREVVAGAGAVGYIEVGTPDQLQAYPIGSSNITVSGKTITITHPDKVFPNDTQIFIYLQAGAVKAKTNGAIVSPPVDKVSNASYFNTGDVNAPVAKFTPKPYADSKTYEPVETNIIIEFDEEIYNIDGTVITNGDVTSGGLFTVNDGPGNVNFIGTILGKVVTLDPTSNLAENATVTITVVAGKIKDVKGHVSAGQTSTFMTVDKTKPVVSAVVVTPGDKKLTFDAVVTDVNNKEIYLLILPKGGNPTEGEIKAGKKIALSGNPAAVNNEFTGLMASAEYEIWYIAVDSRGNESDIAKAAGKTFDTIAPLLVSTDPATGAVDVNVDAGNIKVKLTFNENVVAGAGAITVKDYATQTQIMMLSAANLTAVAGDSKSLLLTIPGFNTITTDALKFYVEIAAGAIKDVATIPNSYGGLFGMDALALTSEDNMAPTVNAGGSTSGNIKLDADIKVAFSENVKGGSGSMILYKGTVVPANAVQVFYASDAVFLGKTATVKPTANLVNGQAYIMAVGAGFAKDVSSNANPSVPGSITFTGTTNPPPSVIQFTPAGGDIAIAKGGLTSIKVDFSENIYLTVNGNRKPLTLLTQAELLANVKMVDGNGVVVPIKLIVKWGAAQIEVQIDDKNLKHEWSYVLTISGFEDIDGQVMSPDVEKYKTTDGAVPTITFVPKNDTKDVMVNSPLTMTFSRKIYAKVISANDSIWANVDNSNVEAFVYLQKGSVGGTDVPFKATISGNVITIVPTKALESATDYFYGLKKSVEDINSQAILPGTAGSWAKFTTKDIVAPKPGDITATNFAPLGDNTAKTAGMWTIFDKDIVVSTGSVVIRREDGTIFQTINGSSLSIDSSNKKKLKIDHNPFEDVMNYFVELEASVVTDKSGNPNAAFGDPKDGWLFSTKDSRDLLITSMSPMGDNTARTAELKINMDKAPVANGNKYVAVYKEDGTAVYQIPTGSMSISGLTASYPGIQLDANQSYYARIEANGFTDAYGNNFDGLMDNTWVFSTINNIAPEWTVLSPADNAKDVNPATSFIMTFSRDIKVGSGMIAVRKSVDGSLVEQVDVTTATIGGNMLTFNLTSNLEDNTDYYVIVPAGAVTNTEITEDPFAGILDTYTWNFTTGVYTCDPITVTAKVVEQMECTAVVNVTVETTKDYVLTMNGDTITAGEMTLDAGMYNFVVTTSDICNGSAMLEVKSVPVVRKDTVYTMISAQVSYMDEEAALDTMLSIGNHTILYDYMGCERTLMVAVIKIIGNPTIKEIQGEADESPLVGETVFCVGTVSAVAPGEGFFMQDANAAWSGIWVEFSDASYEGIQIGNGVLVRGEVAEVANVTTIISNVVRFVPPLLTIAPVMVTPSELKAEKYESVLVKVDGALGSAADAGTGEWTISYEFTDYAIVNDWLYDSMPEEGHYYDVTGIVNARLDNYKLEPRIEPDVKDLTLTSINPVEGNTFKVYPNPFNDRITIDNNEKLTRVVISNIAGQRVIDIEYPTREIRTANLVSGIYVISLYTESGVAKTERMIKR